MSNEDWPRELLRELVSASSRAHTLGARPDLGSPLGATLRHHMSGFLGGVAPRWTIIGIQVTPSSGPGTWSADQRIQAHGQHGKLPLTPVLPKVKLLPSDTEIRLQRDASCLLVTFSSKVPLVEDPGEENAFVALHLQRMVPEQRKALDLLLVSEWTAAIPQDGTSLSWRASGPVWRPPPVEYLGDVLSRRLCLDPWWQDALHGFLLLPARHFAHGGDRSSASFAVKWPLLGGDWTVDRLRSGLELNAVPCTFGSFSEVSSESMDRGRGMTIPPSRELSGHDHAVHVIRVVDTDTGLPLHAMGSWISPRPAAGSYTFESHTPSSQSLGTLHVGGTESRPRADVFYYPHTIPGDLTHALGRLEPVGAPRNSRLAWIDESLVIEASDMDLWRRFAQGLTSGWRCTTRHDLQEAVRRYSRFDLEGQLRVDDLSLTHRVGRRGGRAVPYSELSIPMTDTERRLGHEEKLLIEQDLGRFLGRLSPPSAPLRVKLVPPR